MCLKVVPTTSARLPPEPKSKEKKPQNKPAGSAESRNRGPPFCATDWNASLCRKDERKNAAAPAATAHVARCRVLLARMKDQGVSCPRDASQTSQGNVGLGRGRKEGKDGRERLAVEVLPTVLLGVAVPVTGASLGEGLPLDAADALAARAGVFACLHR